MLSRRFHDEPTTGELEQSEAQFAELKAKYRTLEELTEEVKAEAIDLAGTWERGSLETKLDLQRSLFGSTLFFELGTVDPFLNRKNTLLFDRLWLYFAESKDDEYIPEGWVGESELENDEVGQVGVGDGI